MLDSELITLLREHNHNAVNFLLQEYGPLMKYIIKPFLSDYREQEECLSDVAFRIWDKIDTYNEQSGSFKSWISTITRNIALNRAKKIQRDGIFSQLSDDIISEEKSPEEQIVQQENIHKLRMLLNNLSSKDKALIYRKYYFLQSTEQIAAETGLTAKAVEGRLYRIKKKLRGNWHE